jgi:hypothetical protein
MAQYKAPMVLVLAEHCNYRLNFHSGNVCPHFSVLTSESRNITGGLTSFPRVLLQYEQNLENIIFRKDQDSDWPITIIIIIQCLFIYVKM